MYYLEKIRTSYLRPEFLTNLYRYIKLFSQYKLPIGRNLICHMLITARCELISSAARPSLTFLAQGAWWDGRSRPD